MVRQPVFQPGNAGIVTPALHSRIGNRASKRLAQRDMTCRLFARCAWVVSKSGDGLRLKSG
jgi:hypothetical protein